MVVLLYQARAKALWRAGYRTVQKVATALPEDLARNVQFGPYAQGVAYKIIGAAQALLAAKGMSLIACMCVRAGFCMCTCAHVLGC